MAGFELIYGYVHCFGRTRYSAGFVISEEKAMKWVDEKRQTSPDPLCKPANDPICWCPVRACHARRQKAWYAYRKVKNNQSVLNVINLR